MCDTVWVVLGSPPWFSYYMLSVTHCPLQGSSPEGIPSSSEWFIFLGTRYLLYNGSLRTVNMKCMGFVCKEKKGYGVRASERWWKGKETFCTIFRSVRISVPLRCHSSFFAFLEISIHRNVPLAPCRLHLWNLQDSQKTNLAQGATCCLSVSSPAPWAGLGFLTFWL